MTACRCHCRLPRRSRQRTARASAAWFARETALDADDRLRLQWSWARWYAGQPGPALAGALAYIDAARASGILNGSDLAMATSLHLRAGKPVPAVLLTTFVMPADGPWPAPLLAWQRGTLSETALFNTIAGYATDARALALNDVWFHVGQRRLANADQAGAAAAWRWYEVDGVRGTLPAMLAAFERKAAGAQGSQAGSVAALPEGAAEQDIERERQAAELDNGAAQAAQAVRYLHGNQVPPNDDLARYWAERAIGNGNDDGYAVLARLLMRGGADDQRAAIGMVRNLATAGNAAALRLMGHAAMRGIGQPADLAAGRTWYAQAQAREGFATVQALRAKLLDAVRMANPQFAVVDMDDVGYGDGYLIVDGQRFSYADIVRNSSHDVLEVQVDAEPDEKRDGYSTTSPAAVSSRVW